MRHPPATIWPEGGKEPSPDACIRTKPVYFDEGFLSTPVYARDRLQSGNSIEGPALIEEHASTTVIHPGDKLNVDRFGNLNIAIGYCS